MANITKKQAFIEMMDIEENAPYKEILEAEIAALDKRAAAAKKYKAKKNTAMEDEKAIIFEIIDNDPKTIDDILAAVSDKIEGITKNKVVARLKALVDEGKVERFDVKDEGKVKKAYALPGTSEVA